MRHGNKLYFLLTLSLSYHGSAAVKLELLTAATKLFFKRPPEMHKMLGRLLAAATNDTSSQDVHDRSVFGVREYTATTSCDFP